MIIILKKLISTALIFSMIFSAASALPAQQNQNSFVVTASAVETKLAKPSISINTTYGDKVEIKLKNASKYKNGTIIYIYGSNGLCRKLSVSSIKASGNIINVYHTGLNGGKFLSPSTSYRFKAKAVYKKASSATSASVTAKTKSKTYFSIAKGEQLYKLKNGSMVKAGKTDSKQYAVSFVANSKGTKLAKVISSKHKISYIKIGQGKYKGYYVKHGTKTVRRISETKAKRQIVSEYAASMNGGQYVWGGASYKATDCSGLTMQAYKKVGLNISHSVSVQASKGKSVSLKSMQPGDLLILNNYSHVAMYIGGNKMVHAMNSYDGIKIQPISYLQYYRINTIRRII